MHAERDWLVKRVFPALRERLEKYHVNLIDIDLRWGITEEQANNDQVLDLCLEQIDDCRPFFIGLLGDRYGWSPANLSDDTLGKFGWVQHHTGKSVTELEIVHGVLNDPKMHPYSYFFFRDPAFAQDVPDRLRAEIESENPEAAKNLVELKDRIRRTGLPVPPMESYPCRYAGVRINWHLVQADLGEAERSALSKVAAGGIVDPDEFASLDPRNQDLVRKYGVLHLSGLDAFGRRLGEQLWEGIKARLKLSEAPPAFAVNETDGLAEEADYHQRFMDSRLRVNVGREQLHKHLMTYVRGNLTVPCLVYGPPGSGKSAAMALVAQSLTTSCDDLQRTKADSIALVIPHFVGASPASTSLRSLLYRFCSILKREFDLYGDVPAEINKLIVTIADFIRQIPADRPVVFLVDGLNQLDENDNAQYLFWLPWTLPSHVKFVASAIGTKAQFATSAENRNESKVVAPDHGSLGRSSPTEDLIVSAFLCHQHYPVFVEPLTDRERLEIVREVPSLSAKSLDTTQIALLLDNPSTKNPLFLLVALEELRGFGSFDQVGKRIAQLPRFGDTVTVLFTQVIQRLEVEFDPELSRRVLTLLASARRGLSDRELLELIEGEDSVLGTSISDLFPILRQLRPYLHHRGDLWDFYHGNLLLAVQQRYLPSSETQHEAHSRLADYFIAQPNYLSDAVVQRREHRESNVRKVDELPWQLTHAQQWAFLQDTLSNLDFIEAKCQARLPYELVGDFEFAMSALDSAISATSETDRQQIGVSLVNVQTYLRQFSNFVSQHANIFVRDPSLVVPTAYNYAAKGFVVDQAVESLRTNPWGANPWIELVDRPPHNTMPAWRRTLEAHTGAVNSVDIDRVGQLAISGGSDGKLCVWDVMQGVCIRVIQAHIGGVETVALAATRQLAVTGGRDQMVRVWDVTSGECRVELRGHTDRVLAVDITKSGKYVVGAGRDGRILIWDLATSQLLRSLIGHFGPVTSVAFSEQARYLVSGGWDATVRVWDLKEGKQTNCFEGHSVRVLDVSLNDMTQLVASTSGLVPDVDGLLPARLIRESDVRIWSLDGRCLMTEKSHQIGDIGGTVGVLSSAVHGVAISQQGQVALSAGHDGNICIWDLKTFKLHKILHAHTSPVLSVAVDGNARLAVTGSVDQTVRIWDLCGEAPPLLPLKRRVGRIGAPARTDSLRKSSLIWTNSRVRRWLAFPVLALAGALAMLGLPSTIISKDLTLAEHSRFIFVLGIWLGVWAGLWGVDWRRTLKHGSLSLQRTYIHFLIAPFMLILVLPLFPFLRVQKCPICGHLLCGRRHFYHCSHCGFSDV